MGFSVVCIETWNTTFQERNLSPSSDLLFPNRYDHMIIIIIIYTITFVTKELSILPALTVASVDINWLLYWILID